MTCTFFWSNLFTVGKKQYEHLAWRDIVEKVQSVIIATQNTYNVNFVFNLLYWKQLRYPHNCRIELRQKTQYLTIYKCDLMYSFR